jgi:hypothetical protein
MLRCQPWLALLLQSHSFFILAVCTMARRKIQRVQLTVGSNTIVTHICIWRACKECSKLCWALYVPASRNGCNFDPHLHLIWTWRFHSSSALSNSPILRPQACCLECQRVPDSKKSSEQSTETLRNLHLSEVLCLCFHLTLRRSISQTAWLWQDLKSWLRHRQLSSSLGPKKCWQLHMLQS